MYFGNNSVGALWHLSVSWNYLLLIDLAVDSKSGTKGYLKIWRWLFFFTPALNPVRGKLYRANIHKFLCLL